MCWVEVKKKRGEWEEERGIFSATAVLFNPAR